MKQYPILIGQDECKFSEIQCLKRNGNLQNKTIKKNTPLSLMENFFLMHIILHVIQHRRSFHIK